MARLTPDAEIVSVAEWAPCRSGLATALFIFHCHFHCLFTTRSTSVSLPFHCLSTAFPLLFTAFSLDAFLNLPLPVLSLPVGAGAQLQNRGPLRRHVRPSRRLGEEKAIGETVILLTSPLHPY